jgi:molybdopterin converting factor small subunit
MRLTIRYMAQVRQAAGTASEQVEVDRPCTAAELLVRLAAERGGAFARLVLDEAGGPQPTLLLFRGDDQIAPGDPDTLQHGDVVTILSPIAGG